MKRLFRFEPRLRDVEEDVRREVEAHLAERSREFEDQGMDPAAARRAALEAFGDRAQIEGEMRSLHRQNVRASHRARRWEELRQDVRAAVRGFGRTPLYTTIALLTLAVGIGANTAAYSVLRSVVLRPLPYPEPDRLVQVWTDHRARGRAEPEWLTPPQFAALREQAPAFAGVAAYQGWGPSLTGEGTPQALAGGAVTPEFLGVLGIPVQLGRDFVASDDEASAEPVTILTDLLWRRQFAADPGVIGRTIQLSGQPWTVIGVLAPDHPLPQPWEILRPIRRPATSTCGHGCVVLQAIGRLAPGATQETAHQQMAAVLGRMVEADPAENRDIGAWLVPLQDQLVGPVRPALLALVGAVAFVLLLACVNLASLTMVRSAARAREFGVRAALGAGRGRIVRQVMTESLILGLVGGGLGIMLGIAGARVFAALVPAGVREVQPIQVDGTAVLVMVGVTLVCAVLFGLVPALQGARGDVMGVLRGGHPADSRRAGAVRRALVVSELAIALVLLVGAGLLLRTLVNLRQADLGFQPGRVIVAGLSFPTSRYPDAGSVNLAVDALLERLRAHPAVGRAEVIDVPPLSPGGDQDIAALADGVVPPAGTTPSSVWYRAISPGALRLLGVRLLAGREFGPEDRAGTDLSVIITEETARRLWPGQDPVGRYFVTSREPDARRANVVGVVGDIRHDGPGAPIKAQAFFPVAGLTARALSVLIDPAGDPAAATAALRDLLRATDPLMPLAAITSLGDQFDAVTAMPRRLATIVGAFAAAAVGLALIGVYGLMAYVVAQRQREIGVRMALGAAPERLSRWLVGEGLRLTVVGIGAGLLLAVAGTRVLQASLFGVPALDPAVLLVVPVVVAAAAGVACWLPARRARQVDPVRALRAE